MSLRCLLRPLLVTRCTCLALLTFAATAPAQQYDPLNGPVMGQDAGQAPGRVARLAWLSGQVQFAPAGEDDWGSVEVNRPMVIGDRLLTGDDGRAVLELGDASVRIDHGSAFDFLNLDEGNVQIELSQGTLNLAVRDLGDNENFEVDTPTVAFVATAPGIYRIDNSPTGTGSMVTVFQGSGVVYGENGASREVQAGTSYRFDDSMLASVEANGLPEPDDFDRFCETRDTNYTHYAEQQRQYIPPDMIGGDDLYRYGQWNAVPEYGNVWYPRSVPVGWAPYRYGHWAWIDPWGWTWVDNQPWGFAPFHYGRWVYVQNRWGWMPGPVNVRPVYAPALVAFVGGSGVSVSIRLGGGGPVGWFPLGPRDVYVPWFHASRGYFTNVNVTNIRNVYVNRVVINNFYDDYRHQRYADIHRRNHYRYRELPGAVTMVPRTIFANARPVHPAALKLDPKQLRNAQLAVRPDVNPGKASIGLHRPAARPAVAHEREAFARPVVARHAPPPRPVGFAAREKLIARQHGQPLTTEQMRNLRKAQPAHAADEQRVKLVASNGKASRPAPVEAVRARRATATQPAHRDVSARAVKPSGDVAGDAHPAPSRNTAHAAPARPRPTRDASLRPGELPSARFRHPPQQATLPRAVAIRPATKDEQQSRAPAGRLPVVQPVKPASRPQPRADNPAQPPRARIERPQPQPQKLRQEQAEQQARAQQARQRSAAAEQQGAQQQQMERHRAAQAQMQQQQREARMRQPQPVRAPQLQQQRQVQQMRTQQAQQAQREGRQHSVQQPQERPAPRAATRPPAKQHPQSPPKKHPDSSSDHQRIR
jgi:hypothetical protein